VDRVVLPVPVCVYECVCARGVGVTHWAGLLVIGWYGGSRTGSRFRAHSCTPQPRRRRRHNNNNQRAAAPTAQPEEQRHVPLVPHVAARVEGEDATLGHEVVHVAVEGWVGVWLVGMWSCEVGFWLGAIEGTHLVAFSQ